MPGVYVVSHPVEPAPAFAETSCGGWFKGRNPSVNIEVLSANWVADAEIIYIGKANQLRRRLIQYADFGEGKPVGHWGGRLIWQLPNVAELKVAWLETPDRDPLERKAELISLFRMRHGKPPFANDPHRLGK